MFRAVLTYGLAGAVLKTMEAEENFRKYIAIYQNDGRFPLLTEKVFSNIDTHPGQAARKFYLDPRGADADLALRQYWKTVDADTKEMLPVDADKSIVTYQKTSEEGHWGFMAARLPYSGQEKDVLRHMLESFPQGSVIYTESWRLRIEQAPDKAAFIQQNIKEIQDDYRLHLEQGRALDGCGALLGGKCLVKVKDTQMKEFDGKRVHVMTVATKAEHNLDGINLWMASFDPNTSSEVVFSNALIGEHPGWRGIDFINNVIGKDLMFTMWRTTDERAKAEAAGEELGARLTREDPSLVRRRNWYKSLDFFSPLLVFFRNNPLIAPNMTAPNDTYIVHMDEPNDLKAIAEALGNGDYKSLTKTSEPPALIVNEKVVSAGQTIAFEDLSPGGESRMDHIHAGDRKDVDKFIQKTFNYNLSTGGLTKMRGDIRDTLKDVPMPDHSLPVESLVEEILRTTTVEPRLEIATKGVDYKDTADAVADYIEGHGTLAQLPEHEKKSLMLACMYRQTISPQLGPNGVVSTICQDILTEGNSFKTPQQFEAEQASNSEKVAATEKVLYQLKREKEDTALSDPKQRELDRKIEKAEKRLEESKTDIHNTKDARHERENKAETKTRVEERKKKAVEQFRDKVHHGL